MAKFFDEIDESTREFIERQHLFFTATAPRQGRINLSPKGMDTFRVLSKKTVGYLDLTGSGNETAAHIADDGRLTIMFCAFEGKPLILRLYGKGRVVQPPDREFADLAPLFPSQLGTRQIILLEIDSLQKTCGFSVPLYDFAGHRQDLVDWAEQKGEVGLARYRAEKNVTSIDGLPTKLLDSPK